MADKARIGIFKYSCCAGCEFQLIYFQDKVLETLGAVDIVHCRMLTSADGEEGPFDVALVEGAVTEAWQAEQLKKVRERSRRLYPIGSCAVCGGVPAIKNAGPEHEVQRRVYPDTRNLRSMRAAPVDSYVRVDGYIRGCPMGERDFHELILSLRLGREPRFMNFPVCVECKLKNNICVLVAYGEPCMGPVTSAGCGALCPSNGRACYGCWGPLEDANAGALADQFERLGFSREDIRRRFTEFGEPADAWRAGQLK